VELLYNVFVKMWLKWGIVIMDWAYIKIIKRCYIGDGWGWGRE